MIARATHPELAILLDAIARPQQPPPDADWTRLFALAEYHGLTPRLAQWLKKHDAHPPNRASILDRAREIAHNNLQLVAHTRHVCDALHAHGIDVLCIKGPVLAQQLYGDVAARITGDIDLLVRARDFAEAARVIANLGFHADIELDATSIARHLRHQHDLAFGHPDATLLELHVHIAQPHYAYRVDLDAWFAASVSINVCGKPLCTLAPEHACALAVIHGTKHLWSRFDLLADVAAFGQLPVRWPTLRQTLRDAGARRAGSVARLLVRRFFGLELPADPPDFLAGRVAARLADRLGRRDRTQFWQDRILDVAVRERVADQIRYSARVYRKWSER